MPAAPAHIPKQKPAPKSANAAFAVAGVLPAPTIIPTQGMLLQQQQYQYQLAPPMAKRPPPRRRGTKCCCKLGTFWTVMRPSPIGGLLIPGLGIRLAMIMQGLGSFTSAAGTMATAGTNVTQAFASVAVASSDGAINVITEAWKGIDFMGLTFSAEKGQLVLGDNSAFRDYLDSAAGNAVWHAPGELLEQAISVVEKASLSLPRQALARSFMNISGHLCAASSIHLFTRNLSLESSVALCRCGLHAPVGKSSLGDWRFRIWL